MATNKTNTVEETKVEEARVEIFIPKGMANEDPNFFVSINGKNYVLPRGKTSLVPPEVKAEIERARRAQDVLDEKIEQMLEASK